MKEEYILTPRTIEKSPLVLRARKTADGSPRFTDEQIKAFEEAQEGLNTGYSLVRGTIGNSKFWEKAGTNATEMMNEAYPAAHALAAAAKDFYNATFKPFMEALKQAELELAAANGEIRKVVETMETKGRDIARYSNDNAQLSASLEALKARYGVIERENAELDEKATLYERQAAELKKKLDDATNAKAPTGKLEAALKGLRAKSAIAREEDLDDLL